MKAVVVNKETEELSIREVENLKPKENELLVEVKATALNRADLLQRKGLYPPPAGATEIMGLEMAGVIKEVGSNVTGWKAGDRVHALLPGGGYAEAVVIPVGMAMEVPEALSFEEAAAIPEVYLTAYLNLIKLGRLKKDEYVLIHAGASGVGTAAIQLAKKVGAIPIVTAGSSEKLDYCLSLGAAHGINYKEADFAERVLEITEGKGVHLIIDFIGASYVEKNMKSIDIDGRWILVGTLGGQQVENMNLGKILMKRIQLKGSTLRSKSLDFKVELTEQFAEFVKDDFTTKKLLPIIDTVYSWHDVMDAHDYMSQNLNIGKIVLTID